MGERSFNRDSTISADGITVYQLYTEEEFETPAVVLKLVSDRPERTTVELELPNLDANRIGFHPEFAANGWTIGEDTMTFETELDAESSLTTLYLIEDADETLVARALEECTLAAVTPVESAPEMDSSDMAAGTAQADVDDSPNALTAGEDAGDETVAEGEAGPVDTEMAEFGTDPDDILVDPEEELGAQDADTAHEGVDVAGREEAADANADEFFDTDELDGSIDADSGSGDGQVAQTTDGGNAGTTGENAGGDTLGYDDVEETDADTTQPLEETAGTGSEQDGPAVSSLSTDVLVSELLGRIEDGELSEEHRRKLDATGLGADERGDARDARIEHLQSRLSDIEAFNASMEEVLDVHGSPVDVFEEFEERLEAMESEVAALSSEVEDTADWRDTVEPRLDGVEREVDDVTEDVASMEESVTELESELATLQNWREKVTGALKTFMDD